MFCSGPAGGRPEASGVPSLQVTVHWQGLSKCLCRRSRRGPPAGINRKKPSSLWFLRPHVGGEGQLLPTRLFFFFLVFMYLFWLHCIFELRHVGFSSLATDRSWAHCTGISESSYQESPCRSFILLFKKFFWPHWEACGILVPWPGIELAPLHWQQSPNCWIAREVLDPLFFKKMCFIYRWLTMLCYFLLYRKVTPFYILYILFHILFHYGSSQDIECNSLFYTEGPCLSIPYIIVWIVCIRQF